ncbi:hypothetical protein F0562_034786 [Nyssa sinensis]|uniref:Uncharacterized protein n=1 Tax=Nyssa sinensis TaxID=561372 RepID=A0A5J5AB12_9ASTE|nr:hypothetical protein F0562_034786 [Nyssa sinensis]
MAFMASPSLSLSPQLKLETVPTISAAPALLPNPSLSPSPELSPDIAPLFPSPGGVVPSTTGNSIPTIPSNPSPPNPDEMVTPGPGSAVSPSGVSFCHVRQLGWKIQLFYLGDLKYCLLFLLCVPKFVGLRASI